MDIIETLEEKLTSIESRTMIKEAVSSALRESNIESVHAILDMIANTKKIAKATSAILLKEVLDILEREGIDKHQTISVLDRMIGWSEKNKRNLLKLDFKMRKADTLLALQEYKQCLSLIAETAKVLKQADDKIGLVKLYYLESKVYYELKNLPRAKSALTLSRSTSTLVYCPPFLQAKMDLLNGIYLADEKDYKTSTAYLLEALEGFSLSQNQEMVVQCARYLLLMRIMENKSGEARTLLTHKLISPHKKDKCLQILGSVNECVSDRNLRECNDIIQKNLHFISNDQFLMNHLVYLCDTLIDSNILKIIEPYSNISIEYIGKTLDFDVPTIENRLRRMILDERIKGTIDQESMCINITQTSSHGKCGQREMGEILSVLSEATVAISQK
ncbi:26S proteasome regulatory subunit N6 [Nematocida displodere]|uniref:26S proteasome regulatory subunit N6 n=1 Tax=Nematocida displodere TaxID=1805483 RepID=A0A177ECI5_9MICR|nr:26S proteasome regulatory subunit N6 [Nematocida displodere]